MLFPGRAANNRTPDAIVVRPHHKAVDTAYFCANLSCLNDDLLVRQVSSFQQVWLITEEATDRTWLMQTKRPCCPHCGAPLYATNDVAIDQDAIDYAVTDALLTH